MRHFLAVCFCLFAVGNAQAADVRIGAWNLEWFFDADTNDNESDLSKEQSAPDTAEYQSRVERFATAIKSLNLDVLSLEEIENEKVVKDIADKLATMGAVYKVSFVQGKDIFTEQDVAFLVKDGITFTGKRFDFTHQGDAQFKDVSKHQRLSATINGKSFEIVAVHLITSPNDRKKQARTLREWVEPLAAGNLVILGDFNASLASGAIVADSDIGIIRGFETTASTDDLFDSNLKIIGNRSTHVSNKELDRILLSRSLAGVGAMGEVGVKLTSVATFKSLSIIDSQDVGEDPDGRGVRYDLNADQDLSDHYPLVVTLTVD